MKPFCFRSYRPAFSGYGYGTDEFVKAFGRRGWRFTFQPDALDRPRPCREEIVIHSGFPHFFRREPGKIHIARVMLESDSLPRLWADVLNRMDEVWVASSFNVKTFAKGGVDPKKLFVIPDMVDKRFSPGGKKKPGKRFRFLSVFLDLSLRKGWDVMLYEFAREFSKNKSVEWVVQCSPDAAARLKTIIRELALRGYDCGAITVRGKVPTAGSLARLYRSADCYVLPTRGEGFGRPYLEAAACGLPVIATGWGGQLDFLNRKNSRLLDYRLALVPAPEALDCYFLAGQKWAEPSGDDLRRALREMLSPKKMAPVDTAPFAEENVMRLVAARLASVRKSRTVSRPIAPQILVYDRRWKARQPTAAQFLKELRSRGRTFAVAGTGRNARWLAEFLLMNGMEVPFFIDRKAGRFMGKKVCPPDSLPAGVKADAALISSFPAAFAEWREILKGRFETVPVIFYSHR